MERANYRTHPLFDPRGVSSTRGGHRVFSFERRDRAEHEPACIIQVECEESLVIYPVERQGLSLADLAERTKLDPATLANREAGRIPNPTLRALRAYAHALGKQLSWTIQEPVPTT